MRARDELPWVWRCDTCLTVLKARGDRRILGPCTVVLQPRSPRAHPCPGRLIHIPSWPWGSEPKTVPWSVYQGQYLPSATGITPSVIGHMLTGPAPEGPQDTGTG